MSGVAIVAIILFAAVFLASELKDERRRASYRRNRHDLKHVLGGREWWGKR